MTQPPTFLAHAMFEWSLKRLKIINTFEINIFSSQKISNGHTTPHLNGNNAAFEFEEIELEGWKKDTVSDV